MRKDKKKYRILIVEDNTGDCMLIEDYLSEQILNPEIIFAKNFIEAYSLLVQPENNRFDAILLDLSLPDKSGEELIIAISSGSPVIILTGYVDIDFSIKSLSWGIADYLLKEDINASSLYKSIVYNIERKRTNEELKESEKRYSDLFFFSPQPMFIFDPETYRFIQVNQATVKNYGYTEEEFKSMTVLDIRPPEDITTTKAIINQNQYEGDIVINRNIRHKRKNGEIIDVELYSNPIVQNGKKYRFVIAIDITEKKQIDDMITRAAIKAQEEERYEIGSELHDNVCQILATSLMSLRMMKNKLLPDTLKWYNQSKDYIDLASREIRNLSHRLAPAFFEDLTLEDTIKLLLNTFNTENQYKISLTVDNTIPLKNISRDIHLNIYRILQEELRNIVKYAKATAINIHVKVDSNGIRMTTQDNGIGFDPNSVKRGIGLSNIKRRTELFGGSMQIESIPGSGTSITITIHS